MIYDFRLKSFPEQGGIPAPPLFIEEVDAKQTEEFNLKSLNLKLINSLPASPYSLYKQRES